MAPGDPCGDPAPANPAVFATTHWSVVLAAGTPSGSAKSMEALGALCQTYWYPLYAYLRRRGQPEDDAADLVQGFFTQILSARSIERVAREHGKFRSFLLASLNYYVADQHDRASRIKRGGGEPTISLDALDAEERFQLEPADELSPDKLFDRRWSLTLIHRTLARLEAQFSGSGKLATFHQLRHFLPGATCNLTLAQASLRLGTSEGAVKVAVHRLRQRFGELFREEVAQTVASPIEVEEEIRHLLSVLSG